MIKTKKKTTAVIAVIMALFVFAVFTMPQVSEAKSTMPTPKDVKFKQIGKTSKDVYAKGSWNRPVAPKYFRLIEFRYKLGDTPFVCTEKNSTRDFHFKRGKKAKTVTLSVHACYKCTKTHKINGKTYKKGKLYMSSWVTKKTTIPKK